MSRNEYFKDRLEFNRNLINKSLIDLSISELNTEAFSNSNSAIYIFGHLLMSRWYLINMLSNNEDSFKFDSFFGYKKDYDPEIKYPLYNDLAEYFEKINNRLNAEIMKISNFEKEMNTKIPSYSNQLDHVISFLIDHEMYHIGQISLIRKQKGYEALPFK